jgi:hypothetical protein
VGAMKTKLSMLAGLALLFVWTSFVATLATNPSSVVYRNLSPSVWLWQGVPLEATYNPTAVKSVQHLTCTNTQTVGTAAFDPNYAVINMIGHGPANGFVDPSAMATRATMASSTSVVCTASATTGSPIVFELIDFLPQMLRHITVRDLTVSIGAGGNNNGTVAHGYTVDLTKAVAYFQGCVNVNNQTNANVTFTTALINTTQIRVYKNIGDYGFACAVGMAEFK